MSRGCSSATVERAVPKLKRCLLSAGVSHLHRNIISHPLPEVVGKVHLRLREHFVYDRLWDPALQMTKTKTMLDYAVFLLIQFLPLILEYISVQISVATVEKKTETWQSYTFRSMFSNQVNLVLFGSSAQGFITMQVGPFSALKDVTINVQHQFKQH